MQIHLSKKAEKFLLKSDAKTKMRISIALNGLKHKPPLGNIKPYKSVPTFYRLKIGNYRAIFCIEDDIIKVTDIDSRGQIYK